MIENAYTKALNAQTQEEADICFQDLVKLGTPEDIIRQNIGYLSFNYDYAVRLRVEKFYDAFHPFFGKVSDCGTPTDLESFVLGFIMGTGKEVVKFTTIEKYAKELDEECEKEKIEDPQKEIERLKKQLHIANYWRARWCVETDALAKQNNEMFHELKKLKAIK